MMNSLPRWFGRKKSKEKNIQVKKSQYASQLQVNETFVPNKRVAASTQSAQSLSSGNSDSFNENLYVNGQVPRGQFKEYFMPPESKHDHTFAPTLERTQVRGSVRSVIPASNILPTQFARQGSVRQSLLKKSLSVDDVLDETIVPVSAALHPDDNSSNYYNVQALKARSSSQMILNRKNLEHHDHVYINKLIQARCRDPFASSYMGHSLLSELGHDLISEGAESVESTDSGALSMGGGTRSSLS